MQNEIKHIMTNKTLDSQLTSKSSFPIFILGWEVFIDMRVS